MRRFLHLLLFMCNAITMDVMAGTYSLDLEANDGRFSYWRSHDLGNSGAMHASFKLVELRPDEKWLPSASFSLEGADTQDVAGVRLVSGNDKNLIEARIEVWQGVSLKEKIPLGESITLGESAEVRIDWESNGVLFVRIGDGISMRTEIPFRPMSLKVSCSGSELIIHRLMVLSAPNKSPKPTQ